MRVATALLLLAACGTTDLSRATLPFAIEAASKAEQPLIIDGGFVRLRKVGTEPTADEFLEFVRQAHAVLGTPPAGAETIEK